MYTGKKRISIIPSILNRNENQEKRAVTANRYILADWADCKAKYTAHAMQNINPGSRTTLSAKLFGKGAMANARHAQKAALRSKSSLTANRVV